MQSPEIIIWQAQAWTGTECLTLKPAMDGLLAESYLTGRDSNGSPFAIAYKVELASDWRVKHVGVYSLLDVNQRIRLTSDYAGHWFDTDRQQMHLLDGCDFISIGLLPFTLGLPIKRLQLTADPTPVNVALIDLPACTVRRAQYFYTKQTDISYEFRDVADGTKAEITLDTDGLPHDVAGYYTRV